ncbi:MAG: PhzF family phenazine biosynthesis protein [Candidatus Bipolaricaulota bacterium]|nr:PhzF family phenazine biosynthesis protein [Candidatus Bipolaricaulota bacterium]
MVEAETEAAVLSAAPDFEALKALDVRGVILTARSEGGDADFVSRFFAPGIGIDEDPVTGSAHCALAPYWQLKVGKAELIGTQASARGGTVHCHVVGDRVRLSGKAVTVLRGEWIAR